MGRHVHLDAVGGIAGDMFAAALLDCFPHLAEDLSGLPALAGFPALVSLHLEAFNDGVLSGSRFTVTPLTGQAAEATADALDAGGHHGHDHEGNHEHIHHHGRDDVTGQDHHQEHGHLHQSESQHHGEDQHHGHDHLHRAHRDIQHILEHNQLPPAVKRHAQGIFQCQAEAEAAVHGMSVDAVVFHEVGAWDSIADIVTAAYLIDAVGASTWSVSSLPAGRGMVQSAHGRLPLPAPAAALLLRGWHWHDDGLLGERVTPTGAAILHYLKASQDAGLSRGVLQTVGHGFGTKRFPGISNVLRALVFEQEAAEQIWRQDTVLRLAFEVDDQNPEELALGLERLRGLEGVLDVSQQPVIGKKQRQASAVRILLEPVSETRVMAACFNETTTLGIRKTWEQRAVLPRSSVAVKLDGVLYHAKVGQRPDGRLSAKAELDELAHADLSHHQRQALRHDIEMAALAILLGTEDHD